MAPAPPKIGYNLQGSPPTAAPGRKQALTRLLQPSLSGYACVSVLVTASERPGLDSVRETLGASM